MAERKIDSFTNKYSLNKTLRFELIPQGKTLENIEKSEILNKDQHRAESYKLAKSIIDNYHKEFIDRSLSNAELDISYYKKLYYKSNKNDSDYKEIKKTEDQLRKHISELFSKDKEGKKSSEFESLFNKELIQGVIPEYVSSESDKEIINEFKNFTTYFIGFNENRRNIYTDEEKSTGIAFRLINQNLPVFLDNVRSYEIIIHSLDGEDMESMKRDHVLDPAIAFSDDNFNRFLSQKGIDDYNTLIGGYTKDEKKILGLNEYINLYNQQHNNEKLPKLKTLYKQILSDRESRSFILDNFENDNELIESINQYFAEKKPIDIDEVCSELLKISEYMINNNKGIYIKAGQAVSNISQGIKKDWNAVRRGWESEYELTKPFKNTEKYISTREKAFKKIKSFSLSELDMYMSENISAQYISDRIKEDVDNLKEKYEAVKIILNEGYHDEKKLSNNNEAIRLIKDVLDSVKALENTLKPLHGSGMEADRDEVFYGDFYALYERISLIDLLYDKVRNYITSKPYSNDKIKLNFENPQFLNGWEKNKEADYSGTIILRENDYYLAVLDPGHRSSLLDVEKNSDENDLCRKLQHTQIADASKDLPNLMVIDGKTVRKTGRKDKETNENKILEELRSTYLPEKINRIRKSKSYVVTNDNFCREDLAAYIEYYRDRITEYKDDCIFKFKNPDEYLSYEEFKKDVKNQAYQIAFKDISWNKVLELVEEGKVYLFKIYNKDFSPKSSGTPNLHTMYFKMLFDEKNLNDVVYKLSGGAEMFWRKKSIKDADKIIHRSNEKIKKKNEYNTGEYSEFSYDIIKDYRYTVDKFFLHLPIQINFKAKDKFKAKDFNNEVRNAIKNCKENYIIGIDRGERNLIYAVVIDCNGNIIEQRSYNIIKNEYKDKEYNTDYHKLLESKEKNRADARKNWKTVENIKDLKSGYISQVVHNICLLVEKYDAVIVMEDLNSGFKNSRIKVEKQVYQKFEKMLIEKLNYYVNKKRKADEIGGLLNGLQLTTKFESFKKIGKQNGFIFYVPAWMTSKIDPATGFTDLLKPKYHSVEDARAFFEKFDSIKYNVNDDLFEFGFDYSNFRGGVTSCRKNWVVCTYGARIRNYKDANGKWTYEKVLLTEKFKELFEEYQIDFLNDLKDQILKQSEKAFFERLIKLLALTLQMRNSVSGTIDIDYIISPVRGSDDSFYDSRNYKNVVNAVLPEDADANGAYNIARKGLMLINEIIYTESENIDKIKFTITNSDWLKFAQTR